MKKLIQFTEEQKGLIWDRFVAPANGTVEEAKHFVEFCETLGLNPFTGDIVFQRYETKQGPRISFITTRDGLLRIASNSPDYVGAPIANVVREGDQFEFISSEGDVKHRFGNKRGKILGAYAVVYHKRYRPIAVWVEFEEYFKANAYSQGGKSPVWDKMPSAMIIKVAESFALKRQFPLGGLYTAEEMGIELSENGPIQQPLQTLSVSQEPNLPSEQSEPEKETDIEPQAEVEQPQPQETPEPLTPVLKEEEFLPESETPEKNFTLIGLETGTSPSGLDFAKIQVCNRETGEQYLVLAKGKEAVELAKTIPNDAPFALETITENGFQFLKFVNGQGIEHSAA